MNYDKALDEVKDILNKYFPVEDISVLSDEDKKLSGSSLMKKIIEYRNIPRKEKNWPVADKVRNLFDSVNIVLKDTKEATYWEEK